MYAVVSTGGKQLKVLEGTVAVVERLDAAVGESVMLDVRCIADGESVYVGRDALSMASVTAEVVEHFKGDKQIVFKFKKRKGYKRLKGHRQEQTRVLITGITLSRNGAQSKPAVKTEVTSEPEVSVSVAETSAARVDVAGQCAAIKGNGERCANKKKDDSDYCGVHAKKFDG